MDYKNYHKNLNYYTNKTSNGNILTQVCTNINRCFCDFGFTGPDCSIPVPSTTAAPTLSAPTSDNTIKMEKKETPYGKLDLCPIHYNLPNKNNNFLICAVFYLQFSFDFFSYIIYWYSFSVYFIISLFFFFLWSNQFFCFLISLKKKMKKKRNIKWQW